MDWLQDQVLEMEIVTPGGHILTIDECQNEDLFWAMRGVSAMFLQNGGFSYTLGRWIDIRRHLICHNQSLFFSSSYCSERFLGTMPGNAAFWDVVANVLSQYPYLDEQGISTYSFIASSFATAESNITSLVDGHFGAFLLPVLHPSNSSDSLEAAITKLFADATAPYPYQFFKSITVPTYPDFWAWYSVNNGPNDAGHNQILGLRLLDEEALTGNLTALIETYKAITPPGSISSVYLVSGKNAMNALPRGGNNTINLAWRKGYVHSRECFPNHLTNGLLLMASVIGVRWNSLDTAEKA